jgi:hypothetical protein
MTPTPKRFSLGVNYPQHAHLDAQAAAGDFTRMAELGLDAVRVLVPWRDLQPQQQSVDADALERLAALIVHAQSAGLRVLPALAGTLDGSDLMPNWARSLPTAARRRRNRKSLHGARPSPSRSARRESPSPPARGSTISPPTPTSGWVRSVCRSRSPRCKPGRRPRSDAPRSTPRRFHSSPW